MEETVEVAGGHEETVEVFIQCPHCNISYSHWIEPADWTMNEPI